MYEFSCNGKFHSKLDSYFFRNLKDHLGNKFVVATIRFGSFQAMQYMKFYKKM